MVGSGQCQRRLADSFSRTDNVNHDVWLALCICVNTTCHPRAGRCRQAWLYDIPEYLLLSVLLPILISYAIFALSYHYLPRNIFVFIFVAGFFNGGMTGSLHLLLNTLYQLTFGSHDWHTIYDNYLIFVPLLAFPEGLLNGMALAILSVFKPEWLRVFSDRDYIYNHYHK